MEQYGKQTRMSGGFRSTNGKKTGKWVMSSGHANINEAVLLKLWMLIERWSMSKGGQAHRVQGPELLEQKAEVKERCPELAEHLRRLRERLLRWGQRGYLPL